MIIQKEAGLGNGLYRYAPTPVRLWRHPVHHHPAEYAREDDEPLGERGAAPEGFLFEEGLPLFFKRIGNGFLKDAVELCFQSAFAACLIF